MTDTNTHDRATTRQQAPNLLCRILARGHAVSIERGQLVIVPARGKPVPLDWMARKRPELTRQILQAVGMDAFHYLNYDTGRYGRKKAEGLTMQLLSVVTGADAYAIFNVELTRSRTTKAGNKGDTLPAGRFRVSMRHQFYKFWLTTGLNVPASLAAFHDYMGNLRGILISASPTEGADDGRLIATTMQALTLPASVIRQAVLAHNGHTAATQRPQNCHTSMPHKESAPAQQPRGLQPFPSTGENNHGKTVIRERGYTVALSPTRKAPEDQSVDEWTDAYCSPSPSP